MLVFALAFLSCWLNGLSFSVKIMLFLALLIYLLRTFSVIKWPYKGFSCIRCNADGYWLLMDDQGRSVLCSLSPTSAVIGPLFFLHFNSKKQRFKLVLAGDSMSNEDNRRLRMTLKLYGEQLMAIKA